MKPNCDCRYTGGCPNCMPAAYRPAVVIPGDHRNWKTVRKYLDHKMGYAEEQYQLIDVEALLAVARAASKLAYWGTDKDTERGNAKVRLAVVEEIHETLAAAEDLLWKKENEHNYSTGWVCPVCGSVYTIWEEK